MNDGIPAIYDNGVFRPLGPVELPDQAVVRVFASPAPPPNPGDGIRLSAGAWAEAGAEFDAWAAGIHERRSLLRGSSEQRADQS